MKKEILFVKKLFQILPKTKEELEETKRKLAKELKTKILNNFEILKVYKKLLKKNQKS